MVILYELINANLTILILIHFIEKSSYNFIELILKFLSSSLIDGKSLL